MERSPPAAALSNGARSASVSSTTKWRPSRRPTALTSRTSTPGQRLARLELIRRNLEQVVHPPDRQAEAAGADIDHQQRPLVLRERRPVQQPVPIDDREKGATDVDQTDDGIGGTRDPGGREGRQDFTGPAGQHPAGQVAHLKYDDAHRLGVSHLY